MPARSMRQTGAGEACEDCAGPALLQIGYTSLKYLFMSSQILPRRKNGPSVARCLKGRCPPRWESGCVHALPANWIRFATAGQAMAESRNNLKLSSARFWAPVIRCLNMFSATILTTHAADTFQTSAEQPRFGSYSSFQNKCSTRSALWQPQLKIGACQYKFNT